MSFFITSTPPEKIQDVIGLAFIDSASLNFTYNDAGNQMYADVLPAGVDHDSLLNFVANKHIDHTAVILTAGTGLTGGGDISASRSFALADTAVTPGSYNYASLTVDAQGRITAASSGTTPITSHSALSNLSADDHTHYVQVTGRNNENQTFTGTGGLRWATDGGGDVGSYQANRPNVVYAKAYFASQQIDLDHGNGGFGIVKQSGTTGRLRLQNAFTTFDIVSASSSLFQVETSGAVTLTKSSGANLLWTTDGAGNIGAAGANRPNNLYLKTDAVVGGNVAIGTAGKGLQVAEGSNAKMGTATLVAGTVTVNNTSVTANSRIFLTTQSLGTVTVPQPIAVTAKSVGTSFTITSADNTDTSVIAWMIVEAL